MFRLNSFRVFLLTVSSVLIYYLALSPGQLDRQTRSPSNLYKREAGAGSITYPGQGTIWYAGAKVTVTWTVDGTPPTKYLNIDLYNAAKPTRFFMTQLANGLNVDTRSYTWTVSSKVPSGTKYTIRIWAPYKDKPKEYWQLPDSPLFSVTHYPIGNRSILFWTCSNIQGVAVPDVDLTAGSGLRINYFAPDKVMDEGAGITLMLMDQTSTDPVIKRGFIIASGLPLGEKTYDFAIPDWLPESKRYRFRGVGYRKNGDPVVDTSAEFTILGVAVTAGFSVNLSPDKDSYSVGDDISVSIAATGSNSYSSWGVALLNAETHVQLRYQPLNVGTQLSSSQTSVAFKVPRLPTSSQYYYIFYGFKDGETVASTSAISKTFSINAGLIEERGVKVAKPSGGEEWTVSKTYSVEWTVEDTVTGISSWSIEIYGSSTSGTVFAASVVRDLPEKTRSYSWKVSPAVPAYNSYIVRVIGYSGHNGGVMGSSAKISIANTILREIAPADEYAPIPPPGSEDDYKSRLPGTSSATTVHPWTMWFIALWILVVSGQM